jgi:hypothetical protein
MERELSPMRCSKKKRVAEDFIQEGRNQVLYLLLCLGDENVAHDNWHPERADILVDARREIVRSLKHQAHWPAEWPDFEAYTYCAG